MADMIDNPGFEQSADGWLSRPAVVTIDGVVVAQAEVAVDFKVEDRASRCIRECTRQAAAYARMGITSRGLFQTMSVRRSDPRWLKYIMNHYQRGMHFPHLLDDWRRTPRILLYRDAGGVATLPWRGYAP